MTTTTRLVLLAAALGVGLAPTPAAAGEDGDGVETCRSKAAMTLAGEVRRDVMEMIAAAIRPEAAPGDWRKAYLDLVATSTIAVGLCTEPVYVRRTCPFCAEDGAGLSETAAPALALRWLLDMPELFRATRHHAPVLQDLERALGPAPCPDPARPCAP